MRARALGFVVSLCASATMNVSAQTVATDVLSGVRIEYEAALLVSPSHAFIRMTIDNESGKRRSWTVESDATQYGTWSVGRWSRRELEVEDGERRTFELMLPVQDNGNGGWVQLRVFGYGVTRPGPYSVAPLGGGEVAVSKSLGEGDSGPELVRAQGGFVSVVVENFPDDWRAFDGFKTLWLAVEEWEGMAPPAKRAVREWIARGNKLVLVTPRARDAEPYGLGTIVTVPPTASQADVTYYNNVLPGPSANPANWTGRVMPDIETREGLLSLLLLGYLALVAPVNLFFFAPKEKRLRLFWTMPAIALGASFVLAIVIVLQDGMGGSGRRANFVYLMPELKRELVVQEQVSRTGALLSTRFELEEGVVLTDITPRKVMAQVKLRNDGTSYHGDWFRSRTVQAQRIELSRSSRARIEWTGDPTSMTILSSIEDPLEALYYRDESGKCWRAESVLPGRSARLTQVSESDYEGWLRVQSLSLGPAVTARLARAGRVPGTFVAVADPETTNVPIETLGSIDWEQDAVLYAGHIEEKKDVRRSGS